MSFLDRVRAFYISPPPPAELPMSAAEGVAKLTELFGADAVAPHADAIAKSLGGDVPRMPRTPTTTPVGSPGIGIMGGYVDRGERSSDLGGVERYRKFEEWKRLIPAIGGAIRTYMFLVGAPDWSIEPYKADDAEEPTPEDEERAAWLHRQLHGMLTEWKRVVMEHALALIDGARIGVWTGKIGPDGRIGLLNVMTLPMSTIERWDIDEHGQVAGVIQRDPNTGGEIPIARSRLVYSRDLPTTTHPGGDGAMRFLAEAIRRMLVLEKLLDKAFEKDVNGIPIIYAPIIEKLRQIGQVDESGRTYTRADFDADMAYAVTFISAEKRKDAGLILDSSTFPDNEGNPTNVRRFAAEVLHAQATSHAELRSRIKDLEWAILAMLDMEHKAMGRDSGTQSMHTSKMAGTLRVASSVLNTFAAVAQRDLVRPLWVLNGFDTANPADPQNLPTLTWDALEFADVPAVANAIGQLLTQAGVEPGRADDIVEALVANLGLPRLEEIDPVDLAIDDLAIPGLDPRPPPAPDPTEADALDPAEED